MATPARARLPPQRLGPWPLGLVLTRAAQDLPDGALARAVNLDLDEAGVATRRPAWLRLDSAAARDLVAHDGRVYGVVDDVLGELRAGGFDPIAPMPEPVAWTRFNDELVLATPSQVRRLVDLSVRPFPLPATDTDDERLLAPLPGGSWIAGWQGRLLLARGATLLYSEPLQPGVYDPLRDYVQLPQRLTWLAALASGVYVGTASTVWWLNGRDPVQWTLQAVDGPSWEGAALVIPTGLLAAPLAAQGPQAAVWMTARGFVLGFDDGQVLAPQQSNLDQIPVQAGRLVVHDGRLLALPAR